MAMSLQQIEQEEKKGGGRGGVHRERDITGRREEEERE